jgi:hypothetical protein
VHGTDGTIWAGQTVTFGREVLEGESIRDYVCHVARSLVEGAAFLASPVDGIKSLEIALAARRSARGGQVEVF